MIKKAPRLPQQGEVWICGKSHTTFPVGFLAVKGQAYLCLYVDEGVGDTYYIMRKADDPGAFDLAITRWELVRNKWKVQA